MKRYTLLLLIGLISLNLMAKDDNRPLFDLAQLSVDSTCGFPVLAADTCDQAPLLCGEFLNGYCSNNALATVDTIGQLDTLFNCAIDNNEWLRIFPCDSTVQIAVTVSNCTNGGGLEFALLEKTDSFTFVSAYDCQLVADGTTDTLTISNLIPGTIYHLMIDGLAGDTCDYAFEVISGISIVPPEIVEVAPGYIEGPTELCLGDAATYFIVPPEYEIVNDDGCPLPSGACGNGTDSLDFNLVWHVPPFLQILGDSVNVPFINTETPALNDSIISELLGFDITDTFGTFIDTIYGQVSVSYELDTLMMDSTGMDSIPKTVFCSCTGGGSSLIEAKDVYIIINITLEPPFVMCDGEVAIFCGTQYYESALIYCEDSDDCSLTRRQLIVEPWFYNSEEATICEGDAYYLGLGGQFFTESGVYSINEYFTCNTYLLELTVIENTYTNFTVEICEGDCFTFCGIDYCDPGVYECPNPSGLCEIDILDLIVLPPEVNDLGVIALCVDSCFNFENLQYCEEGTYQVPVQVNQCIEMAVFEIQFLAPEVNDLGLISICVDSCFNFENQLYCEEGNYEVEVPGDNCPEIVLFEISIEPNAVLQLGPIIRVCDATNDNYTVSFDILSGMPPYLINGVAITGNSFVSSPIPHGDDYNFEIKDSDPCIAKAFVDGSFDCGPFCNTNAGEMSMEELPTCYEESLVANHLGGAVFNVGDTAEYILHTNSGPSLGMIIDRNANGEFEFIPGLMEYGVTYYASYVVGQNLNGKVDTGHICTVIAPGQPLIFYEPLTLNIETSTGEEEEIVTLGQTEILRASANFSPSQVTWLSPQGEVLPSNGLSLEIRPLRGGIYTITAENELGCQISDEVLVTVFLNPHIFIPNAFTPNSDGNNDTFFIYADDSVDQIYSLQVFNRLGAMVFSRLSFAPNDPALGWDGRYKGQPVNSDVFVYKAEVLLANGDRQTLSGDVIVIR